MQIIQVLLCFLSKLFNINAEIMTTPPINTLNGGISFKNNHTQRGAHKVSINIKIPTVADSTVLDPIAVSYTHLRAHET